ncbi:MAG: EutN/CcmL family microcompartment protein [Lentilactobacillus diolivorans]|nr:EutN/CcmL family microcompartment protein [Lentilactobacillus diolivorans]MDH5105183.1 EutN/CcmL family microcompartment protein [Lentilactobacillus diolivorans]RRG02466.1 MAG: ethanolamine utilization protein EutN [Lactobacillus sp.]
MYMAKVIGSVVSTQKDPSLIGRKLMIVQPIDSDGKPVRSEEVAADTVGAGIGEFVLLVRGAGARKATSKYDVKNDVNDCSIVGIIDSFDK